MCWKKEVFVCPRMGAGEECILFRWGGRKLFRLFFKIEKLLTARKFQNSSGWCSNQSKLSDFNRIWKMNFKGEMGEEEKKWALFVFIFVSLFFPPFESLASWETKTLSSIIFILFSLCKKRGDNIPMIPIVASHGALFGLLSFQTFFILLVIVEFSLFSSAGKKIKIDNSCVSLLSSRLLPVLTHGKWTFGSRKGKRAEREGGQDSKYFLTCSSHPQIFLSFH